jgi:hypothetical protein
MGDHENQHKRQEGDDERRVQLIEFRQLGVLPMEADPREGRSAFR